MSSEVAAFCEPAIKTITFNNSRITGGILQANILMHNHQQKHYSSVEEINLDDLQFIKEFTQRLKQIHNRIAYANTCLVPF